MPPLQAHRRWLSLEVRLKEKSFALVCASADHDGAVWRRFTSLGAWSWRCTSCQLLAAVPSNRSAMTAPVGAVSLLKASHGNQVLLVLWWHLGHRVQEVTGDCPPSLTKCRCFLARWLFWSLEVICFRLWVAVVGLALQLFNLKFQYLVLFS